MPVIGALLGLYDLQKEAMPRTVTVRRIMSSVAMAPALKCFALIFFWI